MVLKSTVTPDIVDSLSKKYKHFVYNPEFLTERNALNDFAFPQMHVFGGDPVDTKRLEKIYKKYSICQHAPTFHMKAMEASFVKYGINSFLSAKVLFWNQYYDLCQKNGADYETVIDAITEDERIGKSHTIVPGHDGKRGFSGSCFPKDIPALINFSGKELSMLLEAWNANCDYRNGTELLEREIAQHIEFNKIS
jgi:UDP-glucose 6-dehydrogenase